MNKNNTTDFKEMLVEINNKVDKLSTSTIYFSIIMVLISVIVALILR